MIEPYLGEIRMFAGNFAPLGWALCNGQLLSIAEYDALFSLLGTTYGGDGMTHFALPDLQGRIPIHPSPSYPQGSKGGVEQVTLILNQMPRHTHVPTATTVPESPVSPDNKIWSSSPTTSFSTGGTLVNMNPQLVGLAGGNQPHDNMMPSTTISFIISLYGNYPNSN